ASRSFGATVHVKRPGNESFSDVRLHRERSSSMGNRSQQKSRILNRFVPQLESLENRWCPSGVSIQINNNAMVIHGDTLGDVINITDNGAGGVSATISSSAGTVTGLGTGINQIFLNTGSGDDTLNYALTSGLVQNEKLYLDLGRGNDRANFDFSPGISNARL